VVHGGVTLHTDTLRRVGARGDNCCLTWAADGSQITTMDDGNWLEAEDKYHFRIYRLKGGPDDFTREDFPGFPDFVMGEGSWFGYGICSVDGQLYCFVSRCPKNHWSVPYRGMKLLTSRDNGATWYRVNRRGEERLIAPRDEARNIVDAEEMFFLEEYPVEGAGGVAYPFSYCAIVQNGQDNSAARDDYIYIYSPNGAEVHRLLLARVRKDSIGVRDSWEYFQAWKDGEPVWTGDILERGAVHVFPEVNAEGGRFGWYSWLPSVVWNPGLGLLHHGQRGDDGWEGNVGFSGRLLRQLGARGVEESGILVLGEPLRALDGILLHR